MQSMFEVAGPGAALIDRLWWLMLVMFSVTFVVVMGLLLWSLFRRRREEHPVPREASVLLWLGVGGAIVPAVVLTVVLGFTLHALSTDASMERDPDAMVVDITGLQWWWNIQYQADRPSRMLRTANELVIPVGRTVRINLASHDVIHSFWVPALHGKIDMIPGRRNEMWIRADTAGVYRAQCAEFCGLQHARMAMMVVALPQADFEEWYNRQLQPARAPETALQEEGLRVFLSRDCALCHSVRGTYARATVGPDLTHLASRRTLAAGTLPMDRASLGGWVSNPQGIKPGSFMPDVDLDARELLALLAYLEWLQ
jgi:cytochrome c oxidase subunit II